KHAGPVRRAIKVRTVMNILGPLLNPARPPIQIMGVAEPALIRPVAKVMARLGLERALVVHGSGLDEIALHGVTEAAFLLGGSIHDLRLTPEDAGLRRANLSELRGGGPEENAARLTAVLKGEGQRADRDAVALNAGALFWIAGRAEGLKAGVEKALDVMASGEPYGRLQLLTAASDA
ncbi:MAG: anthranilate phosphoribosyltransferase, partial [Caulobacteraceae bacterium]